MSTSFEAMIGELGFERVGQMEIKGGEVKATPFKRCDWTGGVYVWAIEQRGVPVAPSYVGRHSYLLDDRCSQHSNGMHSVYGSRPGQRHARMIRRIIEGGQAVGIYAKHSSDSVAEENDLIRKFSASWDLWNRRGVGKAAQEIVEAPPEQSAPDEPDLFPDEAKRRLAATFGVPPESIEITIRF